MQRIGGKNIHLLVLAPLKIFGAPCTFRNMKI